MQVDRNTATKSFEDPKRRMEGDASGRKMFSTKWRLHPMQTPKYPKHISLQQLVKLQLSFPKFAFMHHFEAVYSCQYFSRVLNCHRSLFHKGFGLEQKKFIDSSAWSKFSWFVFGFIAMTTPLKTSMTIENHDV